MREFTCVLVDDSEPILRALTRLLRDEGIDVVGTAATGLDALHLLEQRQPTALIVDMRLPDIDGVEVARRAAELARRRPAVILYTSFADRSLVTDALVAGARAVVLKDAPPSNLLEALAVVAAGGTYVDPRLRTGPGRSA